MQVLRTETAADTQRREMRRARTLRHIEAFAAHFPKLANPKDAFGKCKYVSFELARWLRRRNISAVLVHMQEPDITLWPQADERWHEKPASEWSHYVVKVGGQLYDLTARQFDPDIPTVNVVSLVAAKQQWKVVEIDVSLNQWLVDLGAANLRY